MQHELPGSILARRVALPWPPLSPVPYRTGQRNAAPLQGEELGDGGSGGCRVAQELRRWRVPELRAVAGLGVDADDDRVAQAVASHPQWQPWRLAGHADQDVEPGGLVAAEPGALSDHWSHRRPCAGWGRVGGGRASVSGRPPVVVGCWPWRAGTAWWG